ncbi:type II toxin-antitoxin system RelE/ParE family toxin [Streptomyces sp. NPDC059411]|uniref:type II toxin-antitoxin system RelE family toxin n=1 Tax=Streptomyces sp. NPDC059411 TaxID=3346825 RepID=UPI0036CB5B90
MPVEINPAARRALDKLRRTDQHAARRIDRLISALAEDPLSRGCRRLARNRPTYRVGSGKLRVLYTPQAPVTVVAVGWRRDVYGSNGCSN